VVLTELAELDEQSIRHRWLAITPQRVTPVVESLLKV
jgi:hypothetical protein